jgi:hypothetical protein
VFVDYQFSVDEITLADPIEDQTYPMDTVPYAASTFTASENNPMVGFGCCFQCFFYDPTNNEESGNMRILSRVFPTESCSERYSNFIKETLLLNFDYTAVAETPNKCPTRNVQQHHLDKLAEVMSSLQTSTNKTSEMRLSNFGVVNEHVVTNKSASDGYLVDADGIIRGIVEVKGGSYAPSQSLRQGIATASNIAVDLCNRGVPWNQTIVPVISSNGYMFQFAVVLLLKPCFPYSVCLTSALNASDDSNLTKIGSFLMCMDEMTKTSLIIQQEHSLYKGKQEEKKGLSTADYWLKDMTRFFSCRENFNEGLFHCLTRLKKANQNEGCRNYVVFPYCIVATDKEDNPGSISMVFPRMVGYRIGIPEDPGTRALFLAKVKMSMCAIHQAGIVHMDFYPSNIMWREVGDGVVVKIIDWDAVHDVNEELVGVVVNKFNRVGQEFRRSLFSMFGGRNFVIAETAWDSSLFEVLERNIDDPRLQKTDKAVLDKPLI